jgi:thiopurine S-methyltransferase
MRQKYAQHLGNLLTLGSRVLLVTMEYPQNEMNGPPFSVHEHEVQELYSGLFTIEKVGQVDVFSANPHFRERGLSELMETTYIMTRKEPTFIGRIT